MEPLIIGTVAGATLGMTISLVFSVARMSLAITRLERKLELLVKHAGVDLDGAAKDAASAHLRAGNKIDAIKAYREFTGCGLAEAKAAVEKMQ